MMKIICIFTLLFIAIASSLPAQTSSYVPGTPFIDYFDPAEYNGNAQNWAVIQDKKGIIYVGNNTDIYEYDGNSWYRISFNNRRVRDFSMDSAGTIYVGGSDDFGYLACDQTGAMRFVSLLSKLRESDKNCKVIWRVVAIKDGVYFLSPNKIFHYANDTIATIQPKAEMVLPYGCAINGELFVVISSEGIGWVKNDRIHILPYSKTIDIINTAVVLPYKKDKLIFKHRNSDFYIYHLDLLSLKDEAAFAVTSKKITPSVVERLPTEADGLFSNNVSLLAATAINDSTYAFGNVSGIVIMDDRGKLVQKLDKSNGLKNDVVYCFYMDNNQNLWAGLGKGLAKIEINNPITVFDESNGFGTHFLTFANYRNNLYFGGISKIYYLPGQGVSNLTPTLIPVGNEFTFELSAFKNWLFALATDGLYLVDNGSTKYVSGHLPFCSGTCPKFPDYLFMGLQNGVVALKFKKSSTNPAIPEAQESIVFEGLDYPVRRLSKDKKNNFWVSTEYSGVFYLKFNSANINDYKIEKFDTLNGLPTQYRNYVFAIDSNIYACTVNGLYQLLDGRFTPDTAMGKLFNLYVQRIQKLGNDKYWVIANNQLSLIKRDRNNYSMDAVPYKKINPAEEMFQDDKGILWVGGYKGLFRLDPKKQKDYHAPFNCLIRTVVINQDSTIFNGAYFDPGSEKEGFFLKKSLVQPEPLTPVMEYKYNSITFTYSATYYDKKYPNQYTCKLEGFDKNWSGWSGKTLKEYTNIPQGKYVFRVKAKNIYDTESTEGLYTFTILPPWHKTIWAYILYALFLTGIIYLGIVLNTKRLKAQNKKLEKIVKERTEEILEKNEELRVQNEEIEAQSKELAKLSIVASETDNAIAIMDAEGNFEWFNNAYRKMFGYNFDEFTHELGKNILTVSFNNDIKNILAQCLESKKSVTYQNENVSRHGKKIWTQTTISPILDDDGNIKKLISIEVDIGKIKEYENALLQKNEEIAAQRDALAESNATKDKFFSVISHDLKSPFNALLGFSEILSENALMLSKEKVKIFSDQLYNTAKQLYNLVENLLSWSRVKTGKIKCLPEKADLKEAVNETVAILSLTAKNKNISLQSNIQEGIFVYADPDLISTVLRNLISNAIKFSDINGQVTIDSKTLPDFAEVSVTDTGKGINEENIHKLFREDIHFTTKGTSQEKGTGLGLILCKEFVEKNGGKISVDSKLRKGSKFLFTVPLFQERLK